jgi:hypothetical protein
MISGTAPSVNEDADYSVKVKVSDGKDSDTQSYTLMVKNISLEDDYIDISGKLEDCENDGAIPVQGFIKVYDSLGNQIKIKEIYNETTKIDDYTIKTEMDGDFYFTLDKKVTDLSNVVLKAVSIDSSNNQNSYVRTVTVNVDSTPDVEPDVTDFYPNLTELSPDKHRTVRVVMYDNPNKTYDDELGLVSDPQKRLDFRNHMQRVNFGFRNGLTKWNQRELSDEPYRPTFNGIEISDDFDLTIQTNIINAIRTSGYLKAGEINIEVGKKHVSEPGWGGS